ncbi:PSD1 and planctomycete cytochrome C domain-containing protein [Roseimaritima sediminicola]|uniref:PSD1 and planctomycete cytochrome C domain-containing protein n=1 Tax=Roseimaritima sediminicola TaxID=2662066 RepID=UPI00192A22CB|nr:PSD1 and planctomycete cytochrome C domain-containing protein [Roseimaritima sediminicola]
MKKHARKQNPAGPARWWLAAMVAVGAWTVVVPARADEPADSNRQPGASDREPSAGEKRFALEVRPLLREKCFGCHSSEADEMQGEFDLSSRESMLGGGDAYGDVAVVPGDAAASYLLAMVRREEPGYEMPPKEAEALSQEEVWAVRDWINHGAPWPDEERVAEIYAEYAEGVRVSTSGGLSEPWTNRKYKPEDVWAFQPIERDFADRLDGHDGNPVDAFIDHGLEQRQLEAAPLADRRTLIRRVSFDLLGLPPTPEQVRQFAEDPRPNDVAFAALVDRLLESPHYGEQWARHWLDVVRYADSSGFANDWERPNAWRYRDYVIRSFNEDKPYDRFIREQIAGDEIDRDDPEMLIAAGFLRMGPWEHTGMSVAKVTRQQWLDDITDTVGQVFLAQPLQCCRCHDHKFDPIPTRDYYRFQANFATTQFATVAAEWLAEENLRGMEEDRRYHEMRHRWNEQSLQRLNEKQKQYEREWFKQRDLPYQSKAEAKKAGAAAEDLPSGKLLRTPQEFGLERIARKWRQRFGWELDRYEPLAFTVYNGSTREPPRGGGRIKMPKAPLKPTELPQTTILTGGDVFSPGEPVDPGVLSAVPGGLETAITGKRGGRRTELANWIANAENSLTARVMVNRIWSHHFGRGIAGNPNNFGATGEKPTHPRLLDWLATEFTENGWSVKHLHRVIMNSRAYRRASTHPNPQRLADVDPNRRSYAVFLPRRLEAEEIRDAMLFVSGDLNPEIGGIPVRPDMNLEAALQPRMIMGTFAPSYVPNPKPQTRNRRSIYITRLRGQRMPFMETFNQPGSSTSCERRDQSNITPQVFALMNGRDNHDRALALAHRLLEATGGAEQGETNRRAVVERLIRLVYGREPLAGEVDAMLQHWRRMLTRQQQLHFDPPEWPTTVVREAIDENTGKPFRFTEKLFVYEDYQADLARHEASPEKRALSDLCLVLLNSNEFIYVY